MLAGGSSITGLTVTGGWTSDSGGGVWQASTGTLAVVDCVITGNRARLGGGIALATGSTVTIAGTTIEVNLATGDGGGLHVPADTTVDLTGSTVSRNAALRGGGAELAGATLIGGVVSENLATFDDPGDGGGGIAIHGGGAVVGTEVTANGAMTGGGVVVAGGGSATLTDVSIHANTCGPSELVNGIGLAVVDADAILEGTTEVVDHACGAYGLYALGAVQVDGGSLTGGTIARNEARFGGGLYLVSATLTDVIVEENISAIGGGILVFDEAEIVGGRIARNRADGEGGGISGFTFLFYPFTLTLRDVEIVDNTAYSGGGLSAYVGDVIVDGGQILRNTASYNGGGANLQASNLTSIAVDWGEGADDNVPSDISIGQNGLGGYGADATFTCSDDTCQ